MFNRSSASHRRPALPRTAPVAGASALVAMAALCAISPGRANANLTITPTFDTSITNDPNAAAIEGGINSAIGVLEADIANPITVSVYFQDPHPGSEVFGNNTGQFYASYYDYYNHLKAIDTAPGASLAQKTAFASLGAAPTGQSSANPVNGNPSSPIGFTPTNALALGFSPSPDLKIQASNGQSYDSVITVDPTITFPPNPKSGSNYSLKAIMLHELDEVLGIGGQGSQLVGLQTTGTVGPMDLYRYSAPGVRSFDNKAKSAYFSINGGSTVLSYFNQNVNGELADFGDWLSDPIPAGYGPQVQDAFASLGADPALGINEYTSLEVEGYTLATPEPSAMGIALCGVLPMLLRRRRSSPAAG